MVPTAGILLLNAPLTIKLKHWSGVHGKNTANAAPVLALHFYDAAIA